MKKNNLVKYLKIGFKVSLVSIFSSLLLFIPKVYAAFLSLTNTNLGLFIFAGLIFLGLIVNGYLFNRYKKWIF